MAGRRDACLVSLPLVAAGWLGAHSLAYLLVSPRPEHHEHPHGYLSIAPVLGAGAAALLLAGLAITVHNGFRGRRPARIPTVRIAVVALLCFAVQEHVERLLAMRAIPLGAALEPTFVVGMALQLPLVVAAVLIARAVVALGYGFGRRLAAPHAPRWSVTVAARTRMWPAPAIRRLPLLATGHSGRAPPTA